MLNTRIVEKACRRYAVQGVLTTVVLSLIVVALSMWVPEWNLIVPMIVTDIFSLTVCIVEALVLRCVAQHDIENLHNFFTAATGIRMLLALLTLTVCYLAEGRDAMLPYCAVFMSFYFVFLIHHSVFFTRVLNSHAKCDKEK